MALAVRRRSRLTDRVCGRSWMTGARSPFSCPYALWRRPLVRTAGIRYLPLSACCRQWCGHHLTLRVDSRNRKVEERRLRMGDGLACRHRWLSRGYDTGHASIEHLQHCKSALSRLTTFNILLLMHICQRVVCFPAHQQGPMVGALAYVNLSSIMPWFCARFDTPAL